MVLKICKALEKAKVDYAVVGGHAVALHGAVRGTVNLDLIVKWTLPTLKKLEKTLNELSLFSRLPISASDVYQFRDEYTRNRNLIAWNFTNKTNPTEQVDIIITMDVSTVTVDRIKTRGGVIKVLSKSDLIKMKKDSGRKQDLEDARALEKLL